MNADDRATPDYYSAEEMTRPGHRPQLVSNVYTGWTYAACSCGWARESLTGPDANLVARCWEHVAAVDAAAGAGWVGEPVAPETPGSWL